MYADGVELVIPLQVLKEFCVTISRDKIFVRPADTPTIVALAEQVLAEFPILNEPAAAGSLLVKLVERFHLRGRAIFDAAIVAVMQAHGVPALLTNNAAHFERFRELIEIIPLAA
jgi:predicted nucleic acid-binding protein